MNYKDKYLKYKLKCEFLLKSKQSGGSMSNSTKISNNYIGFKIPGYNSTSFYPSIPPQSQRNEVHMTILNFNFLYDDSKISKIIQSIYNKYSFTHPIINVLNFTFANFDSLPSHAPKFTVAQYRVNNATYKIRLGQATINYSSARELLDNYILDVEVDFVTKIVNALYTMDYPTMENYSYVQCERLDHLGNNKLRNSTGEPPKGYPVTKHPTGMLPLLRPHDTTVIGQLTDFAKKDMYPSPRHIINGVNRYYYYNGKTPPIEYMRVYRYAKTDQCHISITNAKYPYVGQKMPSKPYDGALSTLHLHTVTKI